MESNREFPTDELTRLVEYYFDLQEKGVEVRLEEICVDAPHLLEPLAIQIESLKKMDQVLDSSWGDESVAEQTQPRNSIGKRSGNASADSEYVIQRFLAHGGCSEVYLAEDTNLGRTVAIKFLRPDVENLHSYRARLQREAEITSQLDHPGIVSIHAQGNDEFGMPFYTMRFVDGTSLGQLVKRFHASGFAPEKPEFRKLINHLVDVCQTIAYAHSRGIIHRDLKPENIVTGSFGETYIVDWGLAKHVAQDEETFPAEVSVDSTLETKSEQLTKLGNAIGTPAFMSPEQAAGADVGMASDIFNLGATLYTILTGVPPYGDSSLISVMKNARHAKYQLATERNPKVPKPLAAICHQAMEPNIDQRYDSALQLAGDLENYLVDEPVAAYQDSVGETLRRWTKKHRTLVTAAFTTCIAAVLILIVATQLLLDANSNLARREAEAIDLKEKTRQALDSAERSLYSQQIALADSELKKNNVIRAKEILDACPFEYRSLEWHLLKWLTEKHTPFRTISTQGQIARGISFSPDGSLLAVGHSGGQIQLFDVPSRGATDFETPVANLDDGMDIWQVAISPSATQIAVVGLEVHEGRARGAIHLWDLESKTIRKQRWGHGKLVYCVAWSADGTRIATGGSAGGIRIRDSETLEPVLRIDNAHRGDIHVVEFLDDSNDRCMSAGVDGKLKTWNSDGTNATTRLGHVGGVTSLALGNGRLYTAGNDRLIRSWDLNSGDDQQQEHFFVGNEDRVETIDLSHDGRYLASGGLDRNVRIWSADSGEQIATIRHHSSHVRKTVFDPTGRFLVTSGDDGNVNIWRTGELFQPLPTGSSVRFASQSDQLICASPAEISIWNAAQQQGVLRQADWNSTIMGVAACNQADSFASVHENGTVMFFDSQNTMRPQTLSGNESRCFAAVFNRDDSQLFVGHQDGTIDCWEPASGKLTRSCQAPTRVTAMGITADQKTLVTGSWDNGMIVFWDLETFKKRSEVPAHKSHVLGIAAHPLENFVATTGRDGLVRIWNATTGELMQSIRFGASWLNCLAYTPDGKRLVTGSEHTILFWDTITRKEVLSLSVERCVHSISFSPNGRYMAIAGEDPRIRIWQVGPDDPTNSD